MRAKTDAKKQWSSPGVMTHVQPKGCTYMVATPAGLRSRHRKHLQKTMPDVTPAQEQRHYSRTGPVLVSSPVRPAPPEANHQLSPQGIRHSYRDT